MAFSVSEHGHVAIIELQNPPHNFLNVEQVRDVADALHATQARAAVLAAQGRSFCAGANLAGEGAGSAEQAARPSGSSEALYEQTARLVESPVPFVAAVQGPAIGGGLGFALTATMRVTCPEARFSANFVKLGIHQGFGLSVTLPDLLGPSKAALVLLTGRRFKGEEATELGLADECVPLERVRDRALELATEIATGAPLAIRSINATLRAGLADRIRAATAHEAAEQAKLFATEDAREGVRAYTERREGRFVGR